MKQKLFFAIALGVLLLVAGFNAYGQQQPVPLPPPDRESSIIPSPLEPPEEQAPAQRTRRQEPARAPAQTPAARQTPAAQQAPAARQTPAAQQAPTEQQAPVSGLPDKGFFWGFMFSAGPQFHDVEGISRYSDYDWVEVIEKFPIINNGPFVGYDFGLFTGQVELRLGNDNGRIEMGGGSSSGSGSQEYFNFFQMCFQIPLIAKMDFHLGRFVLQPLVGFYLNFGFAKEYDYFIDDSYSSGESDDYTTPLVGWMLGGTAGFRLGRGFLFTELRYLSDIHGAEDAEGDRWYHRAAALFSLGYQYYFKQK